MMEASSSVLPASNGASTQPEATSSTAFDMDIDMDIDLGPEGQLADFDPDDMITEDQPPAAQLEEDVGEEEGETSDVLFEKINLRGVDTLTTDDIRNFTVEHFPSFEVSKIEWIDDTSANLLYADAEIASQALTAFTSESQADPLNLQPVELRSAKFLSTHPSVPLQIRYATISDIKKPRAREASRFYLLNPEYDPLERRRQGGRSRRHKIEEEDVKFDESMYDDNPSAAIQAIGYRRRASGWKGSTGSLSDDDEGRTGRSRLSARRQKGDLFADRLTEKLRSSRTDSGRLRDRSASPLRDGDGRLGFDEDESNQGQHKRSYRRRSESPNASRELFAGRSRAKTGSRELFPLAEKGTALQAGRLEDRISGGNVTVELFPRKASSAVHRRSAAFDAADASKRNSIKGRGLADRISGGPASADDTQDSRGLRILGAAGRERPANEFSILGAAEATRNGEVHSRVKELFPGRTSSGDVSGDNQGKELFAGRLSRSGPNRRRAEDMFS